MNNKGLILSDIIFTILAFILMLSGHTIVKQPEDKFNVMENEKSIEQIKAEKIAALAIEGAISVLGYETELNLTTSTIKIVLYNPGQEDTYSPSIEYIIIKDEKSYIPLGKSIEGYYNSWKIAKGKSSGFTFSITEPELIANLVNRTYVRVDIAFNHTPQKSNYLKKEIESLLLKVGR